MKSSNTRALFWILKQLTSKIFQSMILMMGLWGLQLILKRVNRNPIHLRKPRKFPLQQMCLTFSNVSSVSRISAPAALSRSTISDISRPTSKISISWAHAPTAIQIFLTFLAPKSMWLSIILTWVSFLWWNPMGFGSTRVSFYLRNQLKLKSFELISRN